MTGALFATEPPQSGRVELAAGACILRGQAAPWVDEILNALPVLLASAPLRRVRVPGGGEMSVAMSNCGALGWVSDPQDGYRYQAGDPDSGRAWPAIPACWLDLAQTAAAQAGYPAFVPDACLINRYAVGARMGLHQDRDERDFSQPIVSVSLGLPARFLFGGLRRRDPVGQHALLHADVVVWGGPSRLAYHGVAPVAAGTHPLLGAYRFNLTFRKAG